MTTEEWQAARKEKDHHSWPGVINMNNNDEQYNIMTIITRIWARAQREPTRHPMSDGGQFRWRTFASSKTTWCDRNCISNLQRLYTARGVFVVGWVNMCGYNFFAGLLLILSKIFCPAWEGSCFITHFADFRYSKLFWRYLRWKS